MSIHSKAILLRCTISKWDGAIRDVSASKQFTVQHNMDENAGVFSKYLVSKSALKPIDHAATAIRRFHQRMTIPWSLDGVGLITNDKLLDYTQGMRALKDAFAVAVSNFLTHYDIHISDARKRLGDRFDLREFPTKYELASKFNIEMSPLPVPSSGHLLVDLSNTGMDAHSIDREVTQATEKAMARMWKSIHTRLSQLQAVLDDPEHRVHKSHFELLEDYVNKLEEFNLFDSQQFKSYISFIRINITGVPIDDIRHGVEVRQRVADKVREAISAAAQFTGEDDGYQEDKNDERTGT
jgi:hypothetical protein